MRRSSHIVLIALVLTAASARADVNPEARKYFEQGAVAYEEARYEEAIDHFLRAYAIDPQPVLVYNAAQGYERLGDVPNALRSYRDYLRLAPRADDRATVETRVGNLERRLRDKGVQQVSVFSAPAGASVEIDGKKVGTTPWTGELPPGRHVAVLRLDGHRDVQKDFHLGPDRAVDLDLALVPGAPLSPAKHSDSVPPAPPAGTPSARADSSEGARVSPLTWVALGVGAVGLGGALGFEFARRGAEDDAESATTQLGHQERHDAMEGHQTVARVLLGVGAVGLAAGGVLLYLDLGGKGDRSTTATFGCGAAQCGFSARGAF